MREEGLRRRHRVPAAIGREGLPERRGRLLRRHARRVVGRAAPQQAAGELLAARGPGGQTPRRPHRRPLGPRLPLPLARVGRHLRRGGARQEHVDEGLQPGQRGLRGLLRKAQERVLLPQGLEGRLGGGVHGKARCVPRLLPGPEDQGVPGLAEPSGVQEKAWIRLGNPRNRSHPPTSTLRPNSRSRNPALHLFLRLSPREMFVRN